MTTGFLHRGDHLHPIHRGWAAEVDADVISVAASNLPSPVDDSVLADLALFVRPPRLPDYDVYVVEAPGLLYLLPHLRRRRPNAHVCFLHTTWRFRGPDAHAWRNRRRSFRLVATADRTVDMLSLRAILGRYVDSVIAASELCLADVPASVSGRVVNPFVTDETADRLTTVAPAYECDDVIFFAKHRSHKGLDVLLAAWERAATGDATLHLAGPGTDDVGSAPGVVGHGFVDDPAAFFGRASAAVHPALFDAFPVSTLETMQAGLPTIVTETTGTRTVVSEVRPDLVVPPTVDDLAAAVEAHLDRTTDERRAAGAALREVAGQYTESDRRGRFAAALSDLLDAVE